MDWQLLLNYVLPYLFGISTFVALVHYAWQRRSIRGAEYLAFYSLAAVDWSICALLILFSVNPIVDKVWYFVSDVGLACMPIAWLAFCLKYTRREKWLAPLWWLLIMAEPLAAILLNIIAYTYTLVARMLNIETLLYVVGYIQRLNNIVQNIHYIYLAILLLAGAFLMLRAMLSAPRMYQDQFIYLLIGMLLPWLFTYAEIYHLPLTYKIDLQPIAFAIGGFISTWSIFRYRVFDILPVALDTIVANINDGVIVLDSLYRIVEMNPAAKTMLNLSLEHVAGIPAPQILTTWENLDAHLEEETPQTLETTLGTADALRYCEARLSPLRDRQNAIFGRMIILQDVTARRQSVEELRCAKEVAEESARTADAANQAKSVFLANMSHELRTPLNAILGFSELMYRDPALNADQRENLETINRSGQHLLTLINDVLEMSKIEAGRTTLYIQSFDLHRMLAALESMFHLRAANKDLQLIFDSMPNVPQYICTDESKLRQVLINLLSNAIKFTAEGGVTLRISSHARPAAPPSALPLDAKQITLDFEVEDTGAGIAPADIEQLFNPFVQTASGQQAQEGTGLGLPISREFVKLLGGHIVVASSVGQGSLFKFSVQATLAQASDVPGEESPRRVKALALDQPIYRLLVVEDRDASRKLLIKLLQPLGFDVRGVGNGKLAVEVFEDDAWNPHLIWMDMRMPVMDGYEATQRIKATTKGQATVIVALTASAFEEDRAMILSNGCDDFLRKPFRESEIFQMLEKHLGVGFIYEDDTAAIDPDQTLSESDLTPALLADLPADWVAALNVATLQADIDATLALLDQIRAAHAPLANALTHLVHNFRFDILMELSQ